MKNDNNPCSAPCPKCGNSDIARQFYAKGTLVKNGWIGHLDNKGVAAEDYIANTCRCCQYKWKTLPLGENSEPNSKKEVIEHHAGLYCGYCSGFIPRGIVKYGEAIECPHCHNYIVFLMTMSGNIIQHPVRFSWVMEGENACKDS